MKCDKCDTTKNMCRTHAFFDGIGIKPVWLCTACGNTIKVEGIYLKADYPELAKCFERPCEPVSADFKIPDLKGKFIK
jgi:hypothetical protein